MSRVENEKLKLIQEKCQVILGNLLREEDNKYCVDCDAKGPRWASWNLGIFLCIRCAGIHRNLGVHISKVKSVNLDTWTPEQVACLQQMGNSQARAVYEANLPDNFRRPQTDSSLESFVRAKYEQKKYIAKEWVPPPAPKPAFDIEEEKRMEKERKKCRTKISSNVEIPTLPQHPTALPRPHSVGPHSPVTKAVVQDSSKKAVQQIPGSEDLLNLGDSNTVDKDDLVFDAFLSAPPLSVGTSAPSTPAVSHENVILNVNKSTVDVDFFNQMGVTDASQSNKMTKESILSLYGSNACQMPATQPMPPMYGVPGGVYVGQQAYTHVSMPGYHTAPNQAMNVNNPGTNVSAVYNPFASLSTTMRQDARLQPNTWLGLQPSAGADPVIMTNNLGQVQHQMANLQLSGQTWNVGVAPVNSTGMVVGNAQTGTGIMWPATHGPSVSNNLWQ